MLLRVQRTGRAKDGRRHRGACYRRPGGAVPIARRADGCARNKPCNRSNCVAHQQHRSETNGAFWQIVPALTDIAARSPDVPGSGRMYLSRRSYPRSYRPCPNVMPLALKLDRPISLCG